MRVSQLILAGLAAVVGTGAVQATTYTYTFSTCASYSCTTPLETIVGFSTGTVVTAPPVPPSGYSVLQPITDVVATVGTFTGFSLKSYKFGARVGSLLQFDGLVAANGEDAYSPLGFPTLVGAPGSVSTDLPLIIGAGTYNGLGIYACFNAACTSNTPTQEKVILTVTAVEDAVPEPATWAMMLIGFAAIGGTVRQRRSAQISFD